MKISLGCGTADSAPAPLTCVEYSNHRVPIRSPEMKCVPMPMELKRRRKWQRSFFEWYSDNEDRFAIKLALLRRTGGQLDVGFCGVSRVVTACIMCDEITVVVEWQGFCWDVIQDFETYPRRVANGYVCHQCPEDNRPVYSSREALRCVEVFEPFLKWVNHDLANADAVSISGTPDEASWARLVPSRIPAVTQHAPSG